MVTGYPELTRALDDGHAKMGIVIPWDFSQRLSDGRPVEVQALVDASDDNSANVLIGYSQAVVQGYSAQIQIEVMRQPLEDGTVCIARAAMSLTFPARFMLTAAMNPCPCGFHNDRTRECHCTSPMIQRYMSKISGPLLDRIDIHIDVPAVNYKDMRSTNEPESSAKILERVVRARQIQLDRFASSKAKLYCNAQMSSQAIRKFCPLSADCERLLERAMTQQGLSARAHDRILKVARTIADLEGAAQLEPKHIAEAIQYRTLDRTYWA